MKTAYQTTVRLTENDLAIIATLQRRLGRESMAKTVRLALRIAELNTRQIDRKPEEQDE